MAVTSTYTIDLVPRATPVVVTVSQFDEGRQIKFNVRENGTTKSLSGYSAAVVVKTRSVRVATLPAVISGSTVTVTSTSASTLFAGRHMGELRITKGSSEFIGSCNFVWEVEPSPENDLQLSEAETNLFADMYDNALKAVSSAQSYANQAKSYADELNKKPEGRCYIFIGDSYGAGYGLSDSSKNWINQTISNLGLSSSNYYKTAVSGSGFIGQSGVTTFLQQLNNLSVSDKESITDIVVAGGWNDPDNESTMNTALKSFSDTVKKNYPNAKIWLAYISWVDSYRWFINKSSNTPAWSVRAVNRIYQRAGRYGFAYIGNMEYVLHNMTYYTGSDGLHPNASGHQAIADHLASALLGGQVDVHYYLEAGTTLKSYVKSAPPIYTALHNDSVFVHLFKSAGESNVGVQFEFSTAQNFSGDLRDWVDILTIDDNTCCRGGSYSELQYSSYGYVQTSDGVNHWALLTVRLGTVSSGKANVLQVSVTDTSGSAWKSYSGVKMIWFPIPNIYMHALSEFV